MSLFIITIKLMIWRTVKPIQTLHEVVFMSIKLIHILKVIADLQKPGTTQGLNHIINGFNFGDGCLMPIKVFFTLFQFFQQGFFIKEQEIKSY